MQHINIAVRQLPKQIFRHYRTSQQLEAIASTTFYEDGAIPTVEVEYDNTIDYWTWRQSDGEFFAWRLASTESIAQAV